jgi:hypothetical protein
VTEWTVDTLAAHMTALVKEFDERSRERFNASETAILRAERATEKRFDSVNEFRGTLADQAARLMPRAEYQVQYAALVDLVGIITTRIAALEARSEGKEKGIGSTLAIVLGLLTLVSTVASVVSVALLHFK